MINAVDFSARLDPQMREALEIQESAESAWPATLTREDVPQLRLLYERERRYWNQDPPPLPKVVDAVLPGKVRDIPLRVYHPQIDTRRPPVIYVHGGGWIVGSLDSHDRIMRLLALASGLPVVGVDYGLAPEHKFPLAVEEVRAVASHLAAQGANYGLDGSRLALAGDSGGANIALGACATPLDGGPAIIKGVLLYYYCGACVPKDSPSQRKYGAFDPGVNEASLAFYRDCLLRTPADVGDPRYDIFQADLSALPPLFLAAAELDPIFDDSADLAEALTRLGRPCDFKVYPGVMHGFLHLSRKVEAARRAIDDGAAWLRQRLLF